MYHGYKRHKTVELHLCKSLREPQRHGITKVPGNPLRRLGDPLKRHLLLRQRDVLNTSSGRQKTVRNGNWVVGEVQDPL